jgi:hypothetical protein
MSEGYQRGDSRGECQYVDGDGVGGAQSAWRGRDALAGRMAIRGLRRHGRHDRVKYGGRIVSIPGMRPGLGSQVRVAGQVVEGRLVGAGRCAQRG